MSITYVAADICCDNPKCGIRYRFIATSMPEIRRRAKAAGWGFDTGKDFCVNCKEPKCKLSSGAK